MRLISLQSGSNGNCLYVEAGGARLLFDAGISGKKSQLRLASHGREIRRADAVILSHDHADHACGAGVFHRKFGLPIWATERTFRWASENMRLGVVGDVRTFTAGQVLRFDGVTVETIPTPHDGIDGVAFVVDDGRRRLGILTDLGHVFSGLEEAIASCDAVLLESNYDPEMLACGPYPPSLQRRIRGPGGHLSNVEAGELLARAGRKLRRACLGHLSENNNDPALAYETVRRIVGPRLPIVLASRYAAGEVMGV